MDNPVEQAVNNLGGPAEVARLFSTTRQSIFWWVIKGKMPWCYLRAISEVSKVPIDDFLKWEELRKGVDYAGLLRAVMQQLKERKDTHGAK